MADLQIFGFKNCSETKKAERYFKERRIAFHSINMDEKPLSVGELRSILNSVTPDELLDTEGKEYRRLQLQYMQFDPIDKIIENPRLIRTPIVRRGKVATVGFRPDVWKSW